MIHPLGSEIRRAIAVLALALAAVMVFSAVPAYAAPALSSVVSAGGFVSDMDSQGQTQTVKVGYFGNGGDYYQSDDSSDAPLSYDAVYLQEVEHYTDLEFEYIDCGTWANELQMLQDHQIDLVGTMQSTSERQETYALGDCSYGITYAALFAAEGSGFSYEDFNAIGSARIGYVQGYVRLSELQTLLDSHGLSPQLVAYDTQDQLADALNTGQIDLAACNSHLTNQGWTVVEKYAYSPFFFASWKGNEQLISQIDEAIMAIDLYETDFQEQTLQEFFPYLMDAPFTKSELEFAAQQEPITLKFDAQTAPLAYWDSSEQRMRGILIDICDEVANNTGLTFVYEPRDANSDEDESHSAFTYGLTAGDSSESTTGIVESSSIFDSTGYLYSTWGTDYQGDNSASYTVAVPRHREAFEAYFEQNYPNYTLVEADTPQQCLEMLRDGEVDLAFLNAYVAQDLLTRKSINNVTPIGTSAMSMGVSLSFSGDDAEMLSSIADKGLNQISDEERERIVLSYTTDVQPENMFDYLMSTQPGVMTALGLIAGVLLLLLAAWATRMRVLRRERATLQAANDQLERVNRLKSDFLSSMSHDIRTPMNAIVGMTSLAKDEVDDPEAMREYLKHMDTSSHYLLGLLNDVLDMSKMENGGICLHQEPASLANLESGVVQAFEPLCRAKGVTLEARSKGPVEDLLVMDELRVTQVVSNLLSNAQKFTPNGGKITLVLDVQPTLDNMTKVDIVVSDTGIGMSRAFMDHLYEPFTQEHDASVADVDTGTGLGLSIVKNLVDIMGGTISADSRKGRGTEFKVALQFARARSEVDGVAADGTDAQEGCTDRLRGMRVLLADDNDMNVLVARRLLESAGAGVVCAKDGDQAVNAFALSEEGEYDIVLMDVRMPRMNGLQAARALRALDRLDAVTVPIVAMSANDSEEDRAAAQEAGMDDYLAKPFDPEELFGLLEAVEDRR